MSRHLRPVPDPEQPNLPGMSYDGWSAEVLDKAETLLERSEAVKPDESVGRLYWVKSNARSVRYRVQVDAQDPPMWVSCTCTHGLNRGGDARCSHTAAALLWMVRSGLVAEHGFDL